jgi:hypothetical protein
MHCLSHEQMLLAAFGLEQDARVTRHLAACASCRRQVEGYRALPEQSAAKYARAEAEEQAALPERSRRRAAAARAGTRSFWNRATRMGGRIMKNRFALGGTAVTVVALLFIWGLTRPGKLSAMERTAQAVRKAKSYQCDTVIEVPIPGIKPAKGKIYWSQGRRGGGNIDRPSPGDVPLHASGKGQAVTPGNGRGAGEALRRGRRGPRHAADRERRRTRISRRNGEGRPGCRRRDAERLDRSGLQPAGALGV